MIYPHLFIKKIITKAALTTKTGSEVFGSRTGRLLLKKPLTHCEPVLIQV